MNSSVKVVYPKARIRLSDIVLYGLLLSLVSIFWRGGRLELSTGNLIPVSLVLSVAVFFVLFPAFWAVSHRATLRFPKELRWALILFASYIVADFLQGTLYGKEMAYLKLISLVFWAFVLANLLDENNLEKAIKAFLLVGLVVTLWGILQFLLAPVHNYLNLFEGDIRGRNASAHALLIWSILLAAYVFQGTPLFSKWLDRLTLLLFIVALLLTLSRGALIAVIVSLMILFLRNGHRFRKRMIYAVVVAGLLFLGSYLIAARTLPDIGQRYSFSSVFTLGSVSETGQQVSNATRLTIAKIGVRMVFDRPWGLGLASFPQYFLYYVRPGDYLPPDRDVIFSPHVQYLDVAVQGGILGLLVFLVFLWPFVRYAIKIVKVPYRASTLQIAIALLWIAHLIYFLFSWPFERVMFWTVIAISSAAVRCLHLPSGTSV